MDRIVRIFTEFNSVIIVLPMHFSWVFWVKYIVIHDIEALKSGASCFSCRSLLLSTILLNDTVNSYVTYDNNYDENIPNSWL